MDGADTARQVPRGRPLGDLSAILGTALAPEANRRYPTVGAFADDLARWLARWLADRARIEELTAEAELFWPADPRFGGSVGVAGFDLQPQEGLVPLGPDPESGLEEFAAYATGVIPMRAPDTGQVHPRVGDRLTFVPIPGGERWIGLAGTGSDPNSPNYAPEVVSFDYWVLPFLVRLDRKPGR